MDFRVYQFNNYYNRILKKFDTIAEYPQEIASIESVAFNPNDKVSTTQIINYDGTPVDYAMLVDDDEIISRWFIIDSQRQREGQWLLTLQRDLLADFEDDVLNCDTFIEKGSLPASSALLYNTENFSVNQIKTKETFLMDATECPWVVGYVAKNATKEQLTTNIKLEAEVTDALPIGSTLEDWEFYDVISKIDGTLTSNSTKYCPPSSFEYITDNARGVGPRVLTTRGVNGNGSTSESSGDSSLDPTKLNPMKGQNNSSLWTKIQNSFKSYGLSRLESETYAYLPGVLTPDQWSRLNAFRNTKILTSDNKLYQIDISTFAPFLGDTNTIPYSSSLGTTLASLYRNSGAFDYFNNNRDYKVRTRSDSIIMIVTRLYSDEYSVSIDVDRVKTEDAPYNIFCIPAGELRIYNSDGSILVNGTRTDIAVATAMALQEEGQDFVYDIQLVPYCPLPGLIYYPIIGPGVKPGIRVPNDSYYTPIKKGDDIVNCVFHVSSSKFSFNISSGGSLRLDNTNIGQKISNQCDVYRLCSPNYSNYFEFNLAKNGTVNYFEVDCQYKPFTPYIHIAPQFGRLYGTDFNDPRGLILGGDFSLPQVTNAWNQYEIQNKNYEQIFGRQIQSMELQHSIAESKDLMNAVAGTFSGVSSGAMMGGMAGGPYAAIAGGIMGGATSLFGGLLDIETNKQLRADAKDLTKDLYGYQLGNIKALPITLSKVSPFNPNNKIFPVLEYYTCTDEERIAFVKKVAYNGMTVGVIGHCGDYLADWEYEDIVNKRFIKGQIVRLDINEPHYIVNTIANELNKGVYIE